MRDKRSEEQCRNETGTVLPFVALFMTVLLLFLAFALDQGVRYAGRTQLQQMVDAAAQAALVAILKPGGDRTTAEAAARAVAANTDIMQGFNPATLVVDFGRYNFGAPASERVFTMETNGALQAVRVSAAKSGENSFSSFFMPANKVSADAESIAALRCRNVVFVQDVSSSFRDDIANIQQALKATVAALARQDAFSGVQSRVGLVAFRNIVVPAATTQNLVAPSDSAITAAIDRLSDPGVLCTGSIKQVSANRFQVPACVGSDMEGGLEVAEELLEPGRGKLDQCEDMVLTISDGVPCEVTPANVDTNPNDGTIVEFAPALNGEPQGGGSTRADTLSYVDREMQSMSIAVLTANSDALARPTRSLDDYLKTCPTDAEATASMQQVNASFAASLIQGFGEAFSSSRVPAEMAAEMTTALQTVPPVVVN
jgi:hypothetical protein